MSFNSFVVQRRIDTIVGFVNEGKYDKVIFMLNDIKKNMKNSNSDLVATQREIISGYLDIILSDIDASVAPQDILLGYLENLKKYLLDLEDAIEIAKDGLLNDSSNYYNVLSYDVRELIAHALL